MPHDSLKLTEMLCARFTHDIIGPVGALNNGAEFLREELGSKSSMAADLIESSAKEAVARVQYYRQAYGYLQANAPAAMDDTKTLINDYFAAGKVKVNWQETPNGITSPQKKLLLNILIVANGTLIRGGTINININENKFTVIAKGEKVSLHENFRKTLQGEVPQDQVDARLIQIYYTYIVAKESGAKIEISENSEQVVFSFTL